MKRKKKTNSEWPDMTSKARKQRGKHGWYMTDSWSLDTYLSRVIGEAVCYLALHDNGYPGTPEHPTAEEWASWLFERGNTLVSYAALEMHGDDGDYEAAVKALHELVDMWGHLWD